MPTIAMIIPTYKRYDDLKVCITSILKQTRLPEELIIVDDDQLDEVPLRAECEQQGIKVIYFRKDKPGLTASRNRGIALSNSELIYFLDDDVALLADYIANIEQVFIDDKQQLIGGVGGVIANDPPLGMSKKLRRIFDRCFLVTGAVEGKVLASGFCVNYGSTGRLFKGVTEVDFLAGGVCAYRKRVFEHGLFDENYQGYGLGEDKDFSYRLSRHCRLVITANARLDHYESPKMRYDKRRLGFEFVVSRYRFFRTHVYNHPINSVAFYYALFGYTLGRGVITLLSFKQQEYQRLGGIFSAIAYVVSGKAKQDLLNEQRKSEESD